MRNIKIREFRTGETDPQTTVTIPLSIFSIVASLLPGKALDALQQNDIDLAELQQLAANPEIEGTVLEVEKHSEGTKTVISIENSAA